jgi:hypothetical protein
VRIIMWSKTTPGVWFSLGLEMGLGCAFVPKAGLPVWCPEESPRTRAVLSVWPQKPRLWAKCMGVFKPDWGSSIKRHIVLHFLLKHLKTSLSLRKVLV